MATYIQGVQGYVPQVQPFQPDFNFYAGALQTKQSQYDSSYKQINNLYGSLLNSAMVREGNIQKREELFNMINQDIKKISGLDLSMPENVFAAQQVFQPVINDQNIIKDMSWTKSYQNAVTRANSFKTCTDEAKCGGQYWDTGMKDLQYQLDDFRNASDSDALNFNTPEFIPYINVMDRTIKLAKDANLNVTQDFDTGQWIVTKKNGELVQKGLFELFSQSLGQDPNIDRMYDAEARVYRRDYVGNLVNEGMSPDEAERTYLDSTLNLSVPLVEKQKQNVDMNNESLISRRNYLLDKLNKDGFITNKEQSELSEIEATIPDSDATSNNLNTLLNTAKLQDNDIKIMRSKADTLRSHSFKTSEILNAALILSNKDASETKKQNPYALAQFSSDLSLRNTTIAEQIRQTNALEQLKIKAKLTATNDIIKDGLATGLYDGLTAAEVLSAFDGLNDGSVQPTAGGNIVPGGQQQAAQQGLGNSILDMKIGNTTVPTVITDAPESTSYTGSGIAEAYESTFELKKQKRIDVKTGAATYLSGLFGALGTDDLSKISSDDKKVLVQVFGATRGNDDSIVTKNNPILKKLIDSTPEERKKIFQNMVPAELNKLVNRSKHLLKNYDKFSDESLKLFAEDNSGRAEEIETSYKAYNALNKTHVNNIDIAVKAVKEGPIMTNEGFSGSTVANDYVDLYFDEKTKSTSSTDEFVKKYFDRNKMALLEDATTKTESGKYNVEGWFDQGLYNYISRVGGGSKGALSVAKAVFNRYKEVGYYNLSLDDQEQMNKLFAIAHQDAEEQGSKVFYDIYNAMGQNYAKLPNASISKGAYLDDGGGWHGDALMYPNLDPFRINSQTVMQARRDIEQLTSITGLGTKNNKITIIPGNPLIPTDEIAGIDVTSEESQAKFAFALNTIKEYMTKQYNKQASRPMFDYGIYAIADNNKNKSARVFQMNAEQVKKDLVGTKANPGLLYDMKDLLSQTNYKFSVIYDNEEIKLDSDNQFGYTDAEMVAKLDDEGYVITQPNGGRVVIKEDEGSYRVTQRLEARKYKLPDPVVYMDTEFSGIPQNLSLDEYIESVKQMLQRQATKNKEAEAGARELRASGYPVPAFTK
jgi:hypothetical protein